jgi:hypothetical protein
MGQALLFGPGLIIQGIVSAADGHTLTLRNAEGLGGS